MSKGGDKGIELGKGKWGTSKSNDNVSLNVGVCHCIFKKSFEQTQ